MGRRRPGSGAECLSPQIMHKDYFPRCPVAGPIEPPVRFGHGCSRGAVPQKCSTCQHLFEGSCVRFANIVGRYLHLDHGPCGIDGPTDAVLHQDPASNIAAEVPRKCSTCTFLAADSNYGFCCLQDAEKWGDFHRGLDWGDWEPPLIQLTLAPPKSTTKEMTSLAQQNDLLAFIQEHRRVNPRISIAEAKRDFQLFQQALGQLDR